MITGEETEDLVVDGDDGVPRIFKFIRRLKSGRCYYKCSHCDIIHGLKVMDGVSCRQHICELSHIFD